MTAIYEKQPRWEIKTPVGFLKIGTSLSLISPESIPCTIRRSEGRHTNWIRGMALEEHPVEIVVDGESVKIRPCEIRTCLFYGVECEVPVSEVNKHQRARRFLHVK